MSSVEMMDAEGLAKVEAKVKLPFPQVLDFIGETRMAKVAAKVGRSSEGKVLSHCNHWRSIGEASAAKERRKPILRMGGAASLACAAARPPGVSKWLDKVEKQGQSSGHVVRLAAHDAGVRSAWKVAIPQRRASAQYRGGTAACGN